MSISALDKSYDIDTHTRESHNCYSYLLNLKSNAAKKLCEKELKYNDLCRRSQPGYAAGYPSLKTKDFSCPVIVKRTLADNPNIKNSTFNQACPKDTYKGAIVVAPGRDYHYYRLNDEGYWTHKPGWKPSTAYDAKNNLIKNPELASRNYGELNYRDFCGYVCVPRDPTKKRMTLYNPTDNRMPNTEYPLPKKRKTFKNRNKNGNKNKNRNRNKNKTLGFRK
jgi:hypothetical protein